MENFSDELTIIFFKSEFFQKMNFKFNNKDSRGDTIMLVMEAKPRKNSKYEEFKFSFLSYYRTINFH